MKKSDRIKLNFTRNWNLPGKERIANLLKPSAGLNSALKNGIIWLSTEDIGIYTTADNYIEYTLLSTGTYEDEIGKLIRISLKPGDVALDIGANIGLQSIRMSQCCGATGIVYAFEPLEYIQKKFSKNIALNRCNNVTLFPVALSDNDGTGEVVINEHIWNQGTFSLNQIGGNGTPQPIIIKVADHIPEINELGRLDLVKIDVEGFEFHVIRGLKNTLNKHRPRIIFEYDNNYWRDTRQDIADCFAFLTSLNYKLYQVTKVGCELITNPASVTEGNIFCIANE